MSDDQLLNILNGANHIELNDEQVDLLLDRVSQKCQEFSPSYYVQSSGSAGCSEFIKTRTIRITSELKQAIIERNVNLEGENFKVYSGLKKAEIMQRKSLIQALDKFVTEVELVTVENLRNTCLIALHVILHRLQTESQSNWSFLGSNTVLRQKILHIEQAARSIKAESFPDIAALMEKLDQLAGAKILNKHRYWSGFFRCSKPKTVQEVQALVADCKRAEQTYKEQTLQGYTALTPQSQ